MTRYYLLIATNKMPSVHTEFFKLTVGSSSIDQATLLKLKRIALQKNWYLSMWSQDVSLFVQKIADSMSLHFVQLNWVYMPIKVFWRKFIQLKTPPKQLYVSSLQLQLINFIVYGQSKFIINLAGSQNVDKPKHRCMKFKIRVD